MLAFYTMYVVFMDAFTNDLWKKKLFRTCSDDGFPYPFLDCSFFSLRNNGRGNKSVLQNGKEMLFLIVCYVNAVFYANLMWISVWNQYWCGIGIDRCMQNWRKIKPFFIFWIKFSNYSYFSLYKLNFNPHSRSSFLFMDPEMFSFLTFWETFWKKLRLTPARWRGMLWLDWKSRSDIIRIEWVGSQYISKLKTTGRYVSCKCRVYGDSTLYPS